MELPKYRCHKEVWALKIKSIKYDGEGEDRESDGTAMIEEMMQKWYDKAL